MRYIKSCGFVAYKKVGDEVYYLIIKGINRDIGFPKGHMESGESEIQTAVRELKEETNVEVEVIDGFRYAMEYKLPRTTDAVKQVIYFLGKCVTDDVVYQKAELLDARFLTYGEAMKLLSFEQTRELLTEAKEFIEKNGLA